MNSDIQLTSEQGDQMVDLLNSGTKIKIVPMKEIYRTTIRWKIQLSLGFGAVGLTNTIT